MKGRSVRPVPVILLCCLSPNFLRAEQRLNVKAPEPLTIRRGTEARQTLQVTIRAGLHINSDKPHDPFLIPLHLTWSGSGIKPIAFVYPKSEEFRVGSDNLAVLTGTFPLETTFQAEANATPGPASLTGTLRYQACNDRMCFPPSTLEVHLSVSIQ